MSDESAPKLYEQCVLVYNAMLAESETREVWGEDRTIWEGFLTKLYRKNGLSVPLYSHVQKELIRMACIRQLRRGGGSSTSVWLLLDPPTKEKFDNSERNPLYNSKNALRKNAMQVLQAQFNELRNFVKHEISGLEKRVEEIERKLNG